MENSLVKILNPKWIVLALALLYIGHFSALSILEHNQLNSHGYDLGNFDQAIWNTAHGRPYEFTTWRGKDDYVLSNSRLGMHVEPLLLLIAPLYRLWDDVRLLLILQSAVVGTGAIGIWLLAKWRLGEIDKPHAEQRTMAARPRWQHLGPYSAASWAGLVLATAFLLNPGLQWALIDDFHAVTLVAGFMPFALYFMLRRRYAWFALFALLIAASKEEMPLVVALMGLYIAIFQGLRDPDPLRRRQALLVGGLTIGVGVMWSALAFLVVIPQFNSGAQSPYLQRYTGVLGDQGLTLSRLPQVIQATLSTLLGPKGLTYLFFLLLPTAFLALFDLPILAIGMVSVAVNVLSAATITSLQGRHYIAPLVPIVLVATVTGIANLTGWISRWRGRRAPGNAAQSSETLPAPNPQGLVHNTFSPAQVFLPLSVLALTASLLLQIDRGFTPLARQFSWPEITGHHRLAQKFFDLIPPEASVSATQSLTPHLTHRRHITIFPYDLSGDYLLLDVTRDQLATIPDINVWLQDLLRLQEFGLVDAADGLLLFKRGEPFTPIPDKFYTYLYVDNPQPEYSARVDFGDAVRFLGFDVIEHRTGEPHFALYLQALRDLDQDYLVTLYLANDGFQPVNGIEVPQLDLVWMPTSLWQPGQTVRLEFTNLPWKSQSLETYSVALGVLDGNDEWDLNQRLRPLVIQSELSPRLLAENTLFHLMQFQRKGKSPTMLPEPRQGEPPRSITGKDQQFLDWARLLGYELNTPRVAPGKEVNIDLYWRALDSPAIGYTVFVQLIGPDGQVYGQHDSPPGYATLSTDQWTSGDLIRDNHRFDVDRGAAPGEYTIITGFYDPATGQRVPLAGSDATYVELATVTVESPAREL